MSKIIKRMTVLATIAVTVLLTQTTVSFATEDVDLLNEHSAEVETTNSKRRILFEDPKPELEIVDEAAKRNGTNSHIVNNYKDMTDAISNCFGGFKNSLSEDDRILKIMSITNHMSKDLGTRFIKDMVSLFTEGTAWSIRVDEVKEDEDDNLNATQLVVLTSAEEAELICIEFDIHGTTITDYRTY